MHEYGIAYDIVVTSRRAALENKAKYITTIYVDVGELSIVNPDQVEFLFTTIVEDDPLFHETKLICTKVPPQTRCACGYVGSEIFVCPECGQLPAIEKGKEVVVTRIEVEAD
ncbi:hydrogenase maturation nickel metallochaperone HypA [Methanospirillum sp. J.3.6.1-F.2.7.3]|jgi:hydrogenase nickel incorporation protein HypA/HybF|uniref:Hydrogenase maturation factor HypA n=2 Tax=Methanospirillum TaxID=2202 RepID=A0A8E7AXZ2_9EURY|nr:MULTISPECIES: hydrogenase maturation nickel metallochaperone HypA [Methanospirillum]MDX8550935.1 hydrogenase maturation nickel metallochaperone HypA [Methanospirillum hungatei]NLW76640.1 hydrogenase maturation nickel metallochaperone HypA [Methanomicrobiales archaeon]QVV87518.1 hydrogenase maturation nickel metallochaperone HypA [Methanospirillum sp. J.3.6.1-F.2.7.3]QXO94982.1 hydrogenase maturation nickel metallochaperone HypA [Methanospirillum hungatei]